MVAKVNSGTDIKGALNYNEQKVQEGKAACIMANLFRKETEELSFYDKLNRFTSLNEKNKRTGTNTLHISLNFDVTEKLKVSELNAIASTYMNRIGFGDQPYLVYEHKDAAHQHVHIVTTIIKKDGKRIPINFLGKYKSEEARKEIEKEFNLVVAERQQKKNQLIIQPVSLQKVVYGKSETKKSIAHVVTAVTRNYKYTSVPELNAVLRQFNVVADCGSVESTMFEKKGLRYFILNEKGEKTGVPIKASTLPGKPTLKFLEKQFILNEALRQAHRQKLTTVINAVLNDPKISTKEAFSVALKNDKVNTVFRSNAEGRTFGVTFIDNNNRTVFNGSDLGKAFSASSILGKLESNAVAAKPFRPGVSELHPAENQTTPEHGNSLVEKLLQSEEGFNSNPEAALRLSRRRKRKKGLRF